MKKENTIIGTGILTAIAASLCCISPVLALLAGTSGIASAFSWIEPFRLYLIGLTIIILGFAWYQKLKPIKKDECGCDASRKPKFIQTKMFLGLVTVFAAIMMAFPYYTKIFYPNNVKEVMIADKFAIQGVVLKIKGMTCTACEGHVKHEIDKLTGIITSEVSYTNKNAIVQFDTSRTNIRAIEEVVNATGYKVIESKIK